MMDLIDRAAVEKALWDYDTWYSGSVDPLHSVYRWKSFLEKVPTVPAVPLEPLCEWLDKNNDFVPFCADDKADCNSCELEGAECIKKRIMLWMEGLDGEVD